MKFTKNILMVLGLLLPVGTSFAGILDRIETELENGSIDPRWGNCKPTSEDIQAATKVENLAAKGSLEDQLISAVKSGNLENVEALIAEGANLEARNNANLTPLMIAAKNNFTDIASRLIDAGARVDAKDRFNLTALFYAVEGRDAETANLLIAHGAAQHAKSLKELLVSAAFKGDCKMVKVLLIEGSRVDHDTLNNAYGFVRNRCSPEIINTIKKLQAAKEE